MANNILQLKGKFTQEKRKSGGSSRSMNSSKKVYSKDVDRLKNKLEKIRQFWQEEKRPFKGVLISVYYNKLVAKSNRIAELLKGQNSNKAIVGAKFNNDKNKKHIITYYVDDKDLEKSINLLKKASDILNDKFNDGSIDKRTFKDIDDTSIKQVIADVSYIDDFEVDEMPSDKFQDSIVTLYDTKLDIKELLKKLGIYISQTKILDNQTIFLNENERETLLKNAPYLVSMATNDLLDITPITESNENLSQNNMMMSIPDPDTEPTIGVIDTLFDKRVYFSKWVDYHDMFSDEIQKETKDYKHGTAVSSIIVDGPRLNPWLEDGCGRFKVRHFGIAIAKQMSSFTIIKKIKEIIINNKDIKVWNLSLGSKQEINDNFISAEAAILDEIQYENDVIFVIAGTNKNDNTIKK